MKKKNAHKPKIFQTYFKDYFITKTKKRIHNKDIYNFNEKIFLAGVRKDQQVITKDNISTYLYFEDLDN